MSLHLIQLPTRLVKDLKKISQAFHVNKNGSMGGN